MKKQGSFDDNDFTELNVLGIYDADTDKLQLDDPINDEVELN